MLRKTLKYLAISLAVAATASHAQNGRPFYTQGPIYAPAPQYNHFVTPQAPGYYVQPFSAQNWRPAITPWQATQGLMLINGIYTAPVRTIIIQGYVHSIPRAY